MKFHWHNFHSDWFRTGAIDHEPLLNRRKKLKNALTVYLKTNTFGSSSSEAYKGDNPYAEALTQHYLTIVKSEINDHFGDQTESLGAMISFAITYSEMWAEAYTLINGHEKFLSHPFMVGYKVANRTKLLDPKLISKLSIIEKSKGIPDEYVQTYHYAEVLSKTYCKALFELKKSMLDSNKAVIKHHASLLGDTLDSMLELMQCIHPNNEPSEIHLPKTHSHSMDRSEWLKKLNDNLE